MQNYLSKAKKLTISFQGFDIQQVRRVKNAKSNALSKLIALLPSNLQKNMYFKVLKKSSLEEPQLV